VLGDDSATLIAWASVEHSLVFRLRSPSQSPSRRSPWRVRFAATPCPAALGHRLCRVVLASTLAGLHGRCSRTRTESMIPETWLPTTTVWVGFSWPGAVTVTVKSPSSLLSTELLRVFWRGVFVLDAPKHYPANKQNYRHHPIGAPLPFALFGSDSESLIEIGILGHESSPFTFCALAAACQFHPPPSALKS